jgi:hypothetical protein
MAAVRAPTIAIIIQNVWYNEGSPRAARTAPVKAKGRAKMVWENFIISRNILILAVRDLVATLFVAII